jgi:tRNA-2-methylthio-N6-dimethylallyladenosine synthase
MEGDHIFQRAPYVDFVLGPRGINNLGGMVEAAEQKRRSIDVVHHQESVLFPWQITQRGEGPKAYVTVVEGCNKPCAFCIVPITRGPEASRTVEHVLEEVRSLVGRGYKEIEFLGQTVNAYKDAQGRRLADLLRATDAVPGVERIRFTTSHPVHLTDDLIAVMAELPRVCPHLHLPVQSGSDAVLRRMRRGYDRAGYLRRIGALRAAVPDIELTTDIIVGFPGETDEDFKQTLSLLSEVRFGTVYGFTYSPRAGTEAAGFEDEVPPPVRDERLGALLETQRAIQAGANQAWIGRTVEVLIDGPSRRDAAEWTGRTPENRIVNFRAPSLEPGKLASVRISEVSAYSLRAVPIS